MSRSKKKKKNLSKEELLRIVFATHHKYEMGSGRVGVMAVGGGHECTGHVSESAMMP